MSNSIYSARKENYNTKSKKCLRSDVFDDKRYYLASTAVSNCDGWHTCKSKYCTIHGLRARQYLDDQLQAMLAPYETFYLLSLHYGQYATYRQRKDCLTQYRKLIYQQDSDCLMISINHWKPSKIAPHTLILHHHIVVGTHEIYAKDAAKKLLSEAAAKVGIPGPTRLRLGFRQADIPRHYLDYCLFLGRHQSKLILPPPDVTWELCRLPKKRKTKTTI